MPIEQQIVVVEQRVVLLALDVAAKQAPELLFPVLAPGELLLERVAQALLGIDAPGVDGKTGVFAREALLLGGEPELSADLIEQIG